MLQAQSAEDETDGQLTDGSPKDRADPADTTESISTDEVFALLSNERRRNVLRHLSTNGGEVRLRELATSIAAEENDVDPVEVTYAQRKRLYTSLYQSHLPRMERSGVIEYDRNSGAVTLSPAADTFDAYLAGLFAAVTLAYATGTPPFGAIPATVVMISFVLLLVGSALVHVRYTRERRL